MVAPVAARAALEMAEAVQAAARASDLLVRKVVQGAQDAVKDRVLRDKTQTETVRADCQSCRLAA